MPKPHLANRLADMRESGERTKRGVVRVNDISYINKYTVWEIRELLLICKCIICGNSVPVSMGITSEARYTI